MEKVESQKLLLAENNASSKKISYQLRDFISTICLYYKTALSRFPTTTVTSNCAAHMQFMQFVPNPVEGHNCMPTYMQIISDTARHCMRCCVGWCRYCDLSLVLLDFARSDHSIARYDFWPFELSSASEKVLSSLPLPSRRVADWFDLSDGCCPVHRSVVVPLTQFSR